MQLGDDALEIEVVRESVLQALSIYSIKLEEKKNRSVVVEFVGLYKPNYVHLFERTSFSLSAYLVTNNLLVRVLQTVNTLRFEIVNERAEKACHCLLLLRI